METDQLISSVAATSTSKIAAFTGRRAELPTTPLPRMVVLTLDGIDARPLEREY